ncbi:Glutathione synthetase [Candidatus Hepatincolaceae symbiont of Richtersius coronifer]
MLKVAFQMDELQKLNFSTDSSYMIMHEAFKRNLEIYFYSPKTLSWVDNQVIAQIYKVTKVVDFKGLTKGIIPIQHEESVRYNLANLDFIFLRQDPPFDMAYITSTFLLEKLMPKVKIFNNPIGVRNAPEKLLVTNFSHLMPRTLISSDLATINQFVQEEKICVIKPLYGNAGSDVFFLRQDDFNAKSIIEYFLHTFKEPIIVQAFIENIRLGDKRIILIDGVIAGALNRLPGSNSIKSNIASGGTARPTELTPKDHLICSTISPILKELGLFFTGIDVIDGYITEINVTSPTGLRLIQNLYGLDISVQIWDHILN